MKYYVVKLFAPRRTFMVDMTPEERSLMGAHAAYWAEQMAKGLVVVFGPVLDPVYPYGLGVIRLSDTIEPDEFWRKDPVILANAGFRCEVAPMARAVLPA